MTKKSAVVEKSLVVSKKSKVSDASTSIGKQKSESAAASAQPPPTESFPTSVSDYRARLLQNKAELYKDPPSLPSCDETVGSSTAPRAVRLSSGDFSFESHPSFRPNLSPSEVLKAGAFGGTYFRPITSSVTGVRYASSDVIASTLHPTWYEGLEKGKVLTRSSYDESVNKYGVKCGGSLGMWESSGWISNVDPYGWFQWYCRFFSGRRTTDDDRQVDRWLKCAGPTGRFKSQLCNKIIAGGAKADDARISPVIRQSLLHWGFEVTEAKLAEHKKRQK